MERIGKLFPEKGRMFSGWRLQWVEQGRARTPRDGRGEFASFMGGDDFLKLTKLLEPNQDHERFIEFRAPGRRGVTRRLVERHVQSEQRREQIVLELRRFLAQRPPFRRHQIDERL